MGDVRNRRLALGLALVVPAMIGLSYASAPFYDWFCRVTGYGGTTARAAAPLEGPARPELVTIRFDANIEPGMPAVFRPLARKMQIHVGETGLAFYEFENLSDETIAGAASFNVTPHSTGIFFDKIACFCFELQELGPGERVEMPVTFFVDPAMLDDPDARGVRTITLSYTMHPAEPESEPEPEPERQAEGAPGSVTAAALAPPEEYADANAHANAYGAITN